MNLVTHFTIFFQELTIITFKMSITHCVVLLLLLLLFGAKGLEHFHL